MTDLKFFVAVTTKNAIFMPTIVECFDNRPDAESYAALMCRAKHKRYLVFEQLTDWDGTENA